MFIDFHSHFLPGIDDGATDIHMSIDMLSDSYSQGTEVIVATPHYFLNEALIDDACNRRDKAMSDVLDYSVEHKIAVPKIIGGFEVGFSHELKNQDNLKKLCIGNTDYILIELPYVQWDDKVIEGVYELSLKGIKPVIAHFERYYRAFGDAVFELAELNVVLQFNCSVMNTVFGRRFVKNVMKSKKTCVMGTDMHNTTSRPCNIKKSYDITCKKLSSYVYEMFCGNANSILY